ncbi:hypothetical protein [Deinococcus ruber]|uniref:Uncharacterized protein n=1 Tax=Deinococcus ruber TaxID=1848197 RepID=A0A918KWG3_9DEIO|nr:hypothetical protein [Deinococcus ruber]GGR37454.1 hypothetical protein GCM10008957_53610 [Deinococcus ruber]
MPLDLPSMFMDEVHPLSRTAAALVQRYYQKHLFPTAPTTAAEWRFCLGVVMADYLLSQGLNREAYTLRLHAAEIEVWTAARYNAWRDSL